MSKYLVTGGAGFIGSHIVQHLLKKGEDVRVLDNLSSGKRENLKPLLDRIELIEGDIRDSEAVKRAVRGVDYIFHEAALSSVPWSISDPITTNEINVAGTLNVLIAARDQGVKKVVCASSSAVYGNGQVLPKSEGLLPVPLSPYAVSKLAAEHYCEVFSRVYEMNVIALRYFNVFGPGQDPTSQYSAVIPKFITTMLRGGQPVIYGDGTQTRDFIYVANVVRANLLCCDVDIPFGVFNVACGERIAIINLVDEINRVLGMKVRPVFAEPRKGDVKHSQADITLAKNSFAYEPVATFHEGMDETIDYFARNYHEN